MMKRERSNMLNHTRKANSSQKKQGHDACRSANVSKNTVVLAIFFILMTSLEMSSAYSSESGKRRYVSSVRSPYRGSTGLKKSVYSGHRTSNEPKTIFRQTLLGPNVCGSKCCRGWKSGNTAMCITPICLPSCKNHGHCIRPLKCLCPFAYTGRDCGQRKHPHSRSTDMLMQKRKRGPRQTLIHVRYSDKSKSQATSSNSEVVCTPTTCFNGGTCVDGSCICRKGYAGKKCEKVLVMRMDSASPSEAIRTSPSTRAAIELCNALCVHGKCTMSGGETPVCQCRPGYYGAMCESRKYGGLSSGKTSVVSKVSSGLQYSNNLLRPVAYSNARRIAVPTPRIAPTIISKYGKCYRRIGRKLCGLSYSKIMTKQSCCRGGLGDGWGPGCSPCRKTTYQRTSQIETKACPAGFTNLYGICKDVNECSTNRNLCSNGICINSRGSYWCRCNRGYHLHVSRSMCLPDKSPSRPINAVSQNQCFLTLDQYGDCRMGSSVATDSKSICCCSVGKAWGLNCEKCPRRGTVEYYKLCPNGPGYLNSISYVIKRPVVQKPSTVRYETKTTRKPIIIPSLTMTDTTPTSRRDKTVLPTSETNIRDSVFDFTSTRSKVYNPTTTQTSKTTQTTTTPLTTTTSTQTTTTQKLTTTEHSTLPDVVTTEMKPESSTTITEQKETTPFSTTTTTKKLPTIVTTREVSSRTTSLSPEFEQTHAETTNAATEAPKTTATSLIDESKSTTTEKEVTTADATTQIVINTFDNDIPLINVDEAEINTPKPQYTQNATEEITTTVRSTTSQKTTTPVSVKSTQTAMSTEGIDDQTEMYDIDGEFYIDDVYELPDYELNLDEMYEDIFDEDLKPTQDLLTVDQSTEEMNDKDFKNNENESTDIVEPDIQEVVNDIVSTSVSSESFSTTTLADDIAISLQSNACSSNPCQNNGECTVEDNLQFKCECTEGYFGMKCETRDHCVPDPCKNGARCEAGMGFYYCDCADGFFGTDCENKRVPKCQSNPCVHGTCKDIDEGYKCECVQGYQGVQCNEDVDECESNTCGENSECTNTEGSFQCVCLSGFNMAEDGLTCEDVNECANTSLCKNGKCVNNAGSYECECFLGYKLENNKCEDLNECDFADCGEKAKCRNMVGGFVCVCPNPEELYDMNTKDCKSLYTEATKTTEIRKPCYSDPRLCKNLLTENSTEEECCCTIGRSWGECETKSTCPLLMSSAYKELCPMGRGVTTGENNKKIDLNECELFGNENMCRNGQCQNSFGRYECVCYKGYYYNRRIQACDDMNECRMRSKCINGKCKNLPGSFRCECPEGSVLRRSGYLTACVPSRVRRPSFPYRHNTRNVAGRSSNSEFRDYCYSKLLHNSRCSRANSGSKLTYKECCCGSGVAWGRSCSKCPQKYTGDYTFLCQTNKAKVVTIASPVRLDNQNRGLDIVGEFHEQKCELPGECENGKCLRTEDGYTCECNAGFQLDEDLMVCMDIDECEELDHVCLNGNCLNQPGSFHCVCQTGFESNGGDETLCKAIESNERFTDSTETDLSE